MSRGALRDFNEFSEGYYLGYKAAVYDNLFTGIAYGAYIMVYVASVYVLLSKPGFTSSLHRISQFGITTFMFALGIITLVLNTMLGFQGANLDNPTSCTICFYVWNTTTCLMCILCDAICAWRTAVLWNNNKRVIAILGFFILVITVIAGCGLIFGFIQEGKNLFGLYFVVFPGLILVTNLLSTGLTAWKAWQRRIPVTEHLRAGSKSVRLERVFALLIESGLIYCCIWILYTISTLGVLPDPGFTLIMFVSGLYPTLIIILVSKQMSPVEHSSIYSTHSTEMRYAYVPALGPPRDGNMP